MILGVIPARMESVRLPNKPLADIGGKSMIQRVWEQSSKASSLDALVIATDSEKIMAAAEEFGAKAIMTSKDHPSGTDRVAEAAKKFSESDQEVDIVVNIQGDIPFINPKLIDISVSALNNSSFNPGIATLGTSIFDQAELDRDSVVKIAATDGGRALYFSRAAIPFQRNRSPGENYGLSHIGLYVYKTQVLNKITSLPTSPLENAEKLEQLRALENGIQIAVAVVERDDLEPLIQVDTPEDLLEAQNVCSQFDSLN